MNAVMLVSSTKSRKLQGNPSFSFPLLFLILVTPLITSKTLAHPSSRVETHPYYGHDARKGVSRNLFEPIRAEDGAEPWLRIFWKSENFSTSTLKYETLGPTVPGTLFYGIQSNNITIAAPIIMQEDGELIWQGREPVNTSNVDVQTFENQTFLTMWQGIVVGAVGRGYELYTFTYDNTTYECYIDSHESQITDRGSLLVTAYNITRQDLSSVGGSKDGWVADCLFYEIDIKSGDVLFRWSSLDHLDAILLNQPYNYINLTSPFQGYTQHTAWDYFHINSVTAFGDGYLVNARHTWSFYKILHNGSVAWRVTEDPSNRGDFTLDKNVSFSWQHDARPHLVTTSQLQVSIFDDNNTNFLPVSYPSSGQLLFVDEQERHVYLLQKLQNPQDPILSPSQGDYQAILPNDPENSNTTVNYGEISVIKEFDADGNQVYTGQFGSVGDISSYRAYKYQWSATPYWQPEVFAELVNGSVNVWASWNGATGYDSWKILAGDSESDLQTATTDPRKGFETKFILSVAPSNAYVQGIALEGNKTLSQSRIFHVSG